MTFIMGCINTKTNVEALLGYMGIASVVGTDCHVHISIMDFFKNQ